MTAAEQRAALAELRRLAEDAEDATDYFRRYGGFTAKSTAMVARRVLADAVQAAIPWLLDAAERGLEQDSDPLRQYLEHLGPLPCAACGEPILGPWQHCDGRDYHEGCR